MYPGSGWIYCMYQNSIKYGFEIASGDIAIQNVMQGKWKAKEILIIQEMSSKSGDRLLELGGIPFIITCFESPLYAPNFYRKITEIAEKFRFSIGFGFNNLAHHNKNISINLPFRFPCYFKNEKSSTISWNDRNDIVIVAANKYRTNRNFIPSPPTFINILKKIHFYNKRVSSPIFKSALDLSLHDRRLEMISYFLKKNKLDIFGVGWHEWENHPLEWQRDLKELVKNHYKGICDDKRKTVNQYRFSICFENMQLPGYVTEKMIDSLVAGSLPIYLGSPDIETIVPKEIFVDIRNFDDFEKLENYLLEIDENSANKMLDAARAYLESNLGKMHTYEGFSDAITGLILEGRTW